MSSLSQVFNSLCLTVTLIWAQVIFTPLTSRTLLLPHLQSSESLLLQHYQVMMGAHLPLLLTGLSGRLLILGRCLFYVRCPLLLSPDHR